MSTFGGDSWVPENVYRKQRVAELLGEEIQADEVRLLSNGSLACLVCPNHPVVNTMPMLQIHRKGAGHTAAAEKAREKKRLLFEEIQKRIATGSGAVPSTVSSSLPTPSGGAFTKKLSPLLTATKSIKDKVLLGQLGGDSEAANVSSRTQEVRPYVSKKNGMFFQSQTESITATTSGSVGTPAASPQSLTERATKLGPNSTKPIDMTKSSGSRKRKAPDRPVGKLDDDLTMQELRRVAKRELKWKEAGWKRDGAGHWSRDENVEFDSDEEIPVDCV